MITLFDAKGNVPLGEISEEQLAFLIEQFEEEWDGDQDYYINQATIEMLRDAGGDDELLRLLGQALHPEEGDIRWSREAL